MDIFTGLIIITAIFCWFMGWYRNNLVFKARIKATDVRLKHGWYEYVSIYNNGGTYDKQMWQYNKRTFEDFYPELAELENK